MSNPGGSAMEQIAKYWGMSGAAVAAAVACSGSEAPTWEEQAFARDAAASLVWPPRSYSCSFCRREFRSAQALGGHMNVHRRDRARLRARGDDGVEEDHQPCRQEHYGGMDRAVSNPSTTAAVVAAAAASTTMATATTPSPSYLSAIIRESKSSKFLMPVSMAMAREQVIYIDDKHDHDGGEDDESARRMKKRRRMDLSPPPPPSPIILPIFLRSRATAAGALVDLHLDPKVHGFDLDPKVQGFDLDHAKVPETTASPSSSYTLEDQQEVDLELRLGTSC